MPEWASADQATASVRLPGWTRLPDEARRALEAELSPARTVRAGAEIVAENDACDQLYLVTDGWACRFKSARDGTRQTLALLLPGDLGNLDSLRFPRLDYGLRAITAASVVALPRERANALALRYPALAEGFFRLALLENAVLSQWALCLGRHSALQRLAHLLCELGVRLGSERDNQDRFEMPLTQEQLAETLGLTSVHVNRMLQQLRADDLIQTGGRFITLRNVSRLRTTGEFDPGYLHLDEQRPARKR